MTSQEHDELEWMQPRTPMERLVQANADAIDSMFAQIRQVQADNGVTMDDLVAAIRCDPRDIEAALNNRGPVTMVDLELLLLVTRARVSITVVPDHELRDALSDG